MKKIILISIFFIGITNFCFAENEKIVKPKSRIGATVGMQWGYYEKNVSVSPHFDYVDTKTPQGIGGNIFYNHSLHRIAFISLNAGYSNYEGINTTATVGLNWWLLSDKIYLGMGGGVLTEYKPTSTHPAFYVVCGISIPVPKYNISIEANAKYFPFLQSGINIGVGYLLP